VEDIRLRSRGFGLRVWGLGIWVLGFRVWVEGLKFRFQSSDDKYRVLGFGDSYLGFSLGFRVSGRGSQISGFKFRV
jgi:hypothetical protein